MSTGLLVRVGIDMEAGKWNSPCSDETKLFCYVPMGYGAPTEKYDPRYRRYGRAVENFLNRAGRHHRRCRWPDRLPKSGHCDPDFRHLTYGDQGQRAARIRAQLSAGDFIVFYAGLRLVETGNLVYSIIGFYTVDRLVLGTNLRKRDWHRNEHTRHGGCDDPGTSVVFAAPGESGRLLNHIPIGSYRADAYRVFPNLLNIWGGLDVQDGYIQRSARLPKFENPVRFLRWFHRQRPTLVRQDNPRD
jgi:Nucleotide modification associated domain 3